MSDEATQYVCWDGAEGACFARVVGRTQVNTMNGPQDAYVVEDVSIRRASRIVRLGTGKRRLLRADKVGRLVTELGELDTDDVFMRVMREDEEHPLLVTAKEMGLGVRSVAELKKRMVAEEG